MNEPEFRLESRFLSGNGDSTGAFELTLSNLSQETVSGFRLAYSALARVRDGGAIDGARFVRRIANFHEFDVDGPLAPGQSLTLSVGNLTHGPRHRLDGPKAAYLTLSDGSRRDVAVGDLGLVGGEDSGELKHIPEGKVSQPVAVMPWPQKVIVETAHNRAPTLSIASDATREEQAAVARAGDLARRLFPAGEAPFAMVATDDAVQVRFHHDDSLVAEAYRIVFTEDGIDLYASDAAGRQYGLTTLAQIRHGAATDPDRFVMPRTGEISDAPRYGWRGAHLDVSRHFWPTDDVVRFLDILAWHKINVFQWHLTDDEGWRLEIKALPELTTVGARRGADCEMVPQLGSGAVAYEGHYTQDDVRAIVAHAARLNIDVVPEIDIPGHCTAVLHALPHLVDPGEPAESYHSVQGYPNNALNPAIPETYDFLETVFREIAELFPSDYIHVGGDEVDDASWQESPLARDLMEREKLAGTPELQAYLLSRAKKIITGLGKKLAGWDEVSHGGGVGTEDTLLVAWQSVEKIAELIDQGYDVIASPGQAYYMDMVQGSGWREPGASWAGVSTPEHCYTYEAAFGLTEAQAARLKGVQACIWSEHLTSTEIFNHMVFPRLGAIAEAAWTRSGDKDWQRFAALSRLIPEL